MHTILIAGAGRIGALIACLLAGTQEYETYLIDIQFNNVEINELQKKFPHLHTLTADVQNQPMIADLIKQHHIQSIISCLPYYHNLILVQLAKKFKLNYFDLTEDVAVSNEIQVIAKNSQTIFMPHCGVAPGFVNIAAHTLMQNFDSLDTAKLRVGALPQHIDNELYYALTWSTDGLINEYGNTGHAIENNQLIQTNPLEDLEHLILDGVQYEAFNTSGGLGTLAQTHADNITNLNYKTIRYPGHCEKIRFLMHDLKLNQDRKTLKNILEHAIPRTQQDVVIIYIAVIGQKNKQLTEETYLNKIYPHTIADINWSAIQVATATSACAAIDLVLANKQYAGFVLQEQIQLNELLANRFGQYYQK